MIELNRRHSGSEQRRRVLVWFWLAQLDDVVSFHIPKPDTYRILIDSILAPIVEDEMS